MFSRIGTSNEAEPEGFHEPPIQHGAARQLGPTHSILSKIHLGSGSIKSGLLHSLIWTLFVGVSLVRALTGPDERHPRDERNLDHRD